MVKNESLTAHFPSNKKSYWLTKYPQTHIQPHVTASSINTYSRPQINSSKHFHSLKALPGFPAWSTVEISERTRASAELRRTRLARYRRSTSRGVPRTSDRRKNWYPAPATGRWPAPRQWERVNPRGSGARWLICVEDVSRDKRSATSRTREFYFARGARVLTGWVHERGVWLFGESIFGVVDVVFIEFFGV